MPAGRFVVLSLALESIVIGRRRLFPLSDYEVWIKQRLFDRMR